MASSTAELLTHSPSTDADRVAELEAALARSERRRAAAMEWAAFLERELEARDERIATLTEQLDRLDAEADPDDQARPGIFSRLRALL